MEQEVLQPSGWNDDTSSCVFVKQGSGLECSMSESLNACCKLQSIPCEDALA